jgi:hypothetical protein
MKTQNILPSGLLLFAAALALELSLGCGGQPTTPAPGTEPAKEPKASEIGWNSDVKKLVVPDKPAYGKLHSQTFIPDKVKFENGTLTFRSGKDLLADQEVSIMLFLQGDEKPGGMTFEIGTASGFGSPHLHLHYKEASQDFPKTEMFMDKYAMKLEFGKEADDKLPGKIYLCAPDAAKSFLAGTFTAEVAADPNGPPRPSDAPYITGHIAIKGKDKEKFRLSAGYVGQTATGEAQSNGAGTEVVLGSVGGWVSSTTFQPRVTTFGYDPKTGCMYKHIKITPGVYLVYAQAAPAFVDWKWVELKESAQMTVDFSIDLAEAGTVEVQLPEKSVEKRISIVPLDGDGKLPNFKDSWDHVAASLELSFEAKKGKTPIEGLRAGSYRVIAGKLSADVQVKAGTTVAVELR